VRSLKKWRWLQDNNPGKRRKSMLQDACQPLLRNYGFGSEPFFLQNHS
jgi:hypothetical protein